MKHFKTIILITITFFTYNQVEAQLGLIKKFKKTELDLYEEKVLDFDQYKNNIGKILFSNEDFVRELPESKYITSYTLGDELGFRAFMKNSPANSMMLQLNEQAKSKKETKYINEKKGTFGNSLLFYRMYLDGKYVASTSQVRRPNKDDFTTLATHRGDLKDDSGVYFGEEMYTRLLEKEELLTPGKHKLKLELMLEYAGSIDFEFKPIAMGEIDLIIPENGSYVKLDECFPKSKMTNQKIKNEITNVVNSNIVPESKLRDVIISSSGWTIIKNPYGTPLKKQITAYMVFTNTDGEVFYYERVFERVFDGLEYSPIQMSSDIGIEGQRAVNGGSRHVHSKCAELFDK